MLALRAIKELEFDRAMGKLSEADWHEMSGRLRARAARLMRQLDAGSRIPRTDRARFGQASWNGGDRTNAVARACGSCGTANDVDARFCKGCGNRL